MAFKAVFHGYSDPMRKQEILQVIARFRAEKAAKCLKETGVTDDAIQVCVERELLHKSKSKAS